MTGWREPTRIEAHADAAETGVQAPDRYGSLKEMVPRDGIEIPSIYLKSCAFLKAYYFVYPPMYPTPSSHSAGGGAPTDSGGLRRPRSGRGRTQACAQWRRAGYLATPPARAVELQSLGRSAWTSV